jgi:alanyl-tRNA synthetase
VNGDEIRERFLSFFQKRDHLLVPSSSLIPAGDPTLLLSSAGMVQFKPYFTGELRSPYPRLSSVQKCFRSTDIDEVGDRTHLTFFEMLGNFSIGDYFKKEAITLAWEFVTEHLNLPPERLWASIYFDDEEAAECWLTDVGLPAERLVRLGEEDNFWGPPGVEGPCGPCSEIHYDFGSKYGCGKITCGTPSCDCDRFVELWNLVFMQFYQHPDGERDNLPEPNIDTGMGLERAAAILQGVPSVYETDLFRPIVQRVEALSNRKYGKDQDIDYAIRVVAEHARSATFLVTDGVTPGNEGRGHILRRVIRRAVRFGRRIELDGPFLSKIAEAVVERMGKQYPELRDRRSFVLRSIELEEERFAQTYERGITILQDILSTKPKVISGSDVFLLYDTYGFPAEMTREIALEQGLHVDMGGFEKEMENQRGRARSAARFGGRQATVHVFDSLTTRESVFLGYDVLESDSKVVAIVCEGKLVDKVALGEEVQIVLESTPFYAEGGGQVGDTGVITGPGVRVRVQDTQRPMGNLIVHYAVVEEGDLSKGDVVHAVVDAERRSDTARSHSATHLIHAALRQVLGSHVQQAGSLVTPDRLRFDFSHVSPLSADELLEVRRLVNQKIRDDVPVHKQETTYRDALKRGALAFFGDRYGERVRVVQIDSVTPFSTEVCGGTHVDRTGQIGYVHILSDSSIGSGMRRIEAISGRSAERLVGDRLTLLESICRKLRTAPEEIEQRVGDLLQEVERTRKQMALQEHDVVRQEAEQLLSRVQNVNGVALLTARISIPTAEGLRETGDWLRNKMGSGVVVLGSVLNGRPTVVSMVTKDLVERGFHAGLIAKDVAQRMGGGGGGRPDVAQAGGKDPAKLDAALDAVAKLLRSVGGVS